MGFALKAKFIPALNLKSIAINNCLFALHVFILSRCFLDTYKVSIFFWLVSKLCDNSCKLLYAKFLH